MPEQLGSDDDIVCGSTGESLVLLVLQIGFVVNDEVERVSGLANLDQRPVLPGLGLALGQALLEAPLQS